MLTTRDLEVVRYLEDGFILTADIAGRLVYSDGNKPGSYIQIAQRRLRALHQEKQVKRIRNSLTNSFIYYLDKTPTQVNHRLKIADFVSRLVERGATIEDVQLEFTDLQNEYHIKPDAFITATYNGIRFQAFIEVDLTKGFTNVDAYTRLVKNRNNIPCIENGVALAVISVCDKPIKKENGKIHPLQIATDFSDIDKLFAKFEN